MVQLVDSRADINGHDEETGTPLMQAASIGNQAIVEFLLGRKADATVVVGGLDALSWAAKHGHTSVCRVLVRAGANASSILHAAAAAAQLALATELRGLVSRLLLFLKTDAV